MAKKVKNRKGCMRRGLVLGKFMPVHTGHMALIEFALTHCDELFILLCHHQNEPIAGNLRYDWLKEIYSQNPKVHIKQFEYSPFELSDSSMSSISHSRQWSEVIRERLPGITVFFSSEDYGKYVAEFLNIQDISFDKDRRLFSVSASQIRSEPAKFWNYIPAVVQPYFVKRIAIVGSESTGKSTLAQKLAQYYDTVFVKEAAREIIGHTKECTYEDLLKIAFHQAKSILEQQTIANRFLFVDTEINITKSYANFLFSRELITEQWIEEANQCDLYLFLEPDCPHIQDGTRLNEDEKMHLDFFHKEQFRKAQINYISIAGNWEERFTLACTIIDKVFLC
jgi:HTH-type transcriptional repressor of NAD biosynthesis genes